MEYIIGSVLILFSLIIIFVVLLQEGRQANVGVISGAADSFMDKGKAKSLDQKLSKWTKVLAIAFFVLVLVGMLVTNYFAEVAKTPTAPEGASNSSIVVGENEGTTNDDELDWGETESDEKDEDKKDESDKKDDTDKKDESDKKDDADKKDESDKKN